MPVRPELYNDFFKGDKTIQKTDKFVLTIVPDKIEEPNKNPRIAKIKEKMDALSGPMPNIREFMVVNITVPNYDFKKEVLMEGIFPFTFPVFGHEGFEIAVMFEDDNKGTMSRFVDWAQKRIIDENGIHFPAILNRIGSLVFEALDEFDQPTYRYVYKDAYFLRATPLTFDYSQTAAQKWSITFGADFSEYHGPSEVAGKQEKESQNFIAIENQGLPIV